MAKSLARRIQNWLDRMQGEAISPAAQRVLDTQNPIHTPSTNDYINRTTNWFAYETAIRTLLGAGGIATIQYPYYLNFGRNLFRMVCRGFAFTGGAGSPGYDEALSSKAAWLARGLDPAVLQGILSIFVSAAPVVAPAPQLPANGGIVTTVTPSLSVLPVAGGAYNFRVYNLVTGVKVAEVLENALNTWPVSPELDDQTMYQWDCRVKVAGVWGPYFTPRWSFMVQLGG